MCRGIAIVQVAALKGQFEKESEIGVIAVPDRDYDAKRWWSSSEGVRDVIDELVAYVYARLIFRPARQER